MPKPPANGTELLTHSLPPLPSSNPKPHKRVREAVLLSPVLSLTAPPFKPSWKHQGNRSQVIIPLPGRGAGALPPRWSLPTRPGTAHMAV